MSAVILESSLVHYEAIGRGRPVLFLHDWLGSWRYWVPTMLNLSSSYRLYALDFWGFGDSDKVRTRYSIEGYVYQVSLFMDQMGIPAVPMIGHGLGGIVAVDFALRMPHLVEQLMLVNVPLSGNQISRTLTGFTGGDNPAARILGRRLNAYEEVALEASKTDGDAVVQSVQSFMSQDLGEQLEDLDLPIMLVYGTQDPLIQIPDSNLFEDLDYNVNTFLFDGAQHYPMLEETSKFNRLLLDFLIHKDQWDAIQLKDSWRRRMR
ncbi:MAG: alpha/beta hydrolase [Anaerolineae bacterium]|nr:alpha/beta hydrolase [Anaerolineae bacterium]